MPAPVEARPNQEGGQLYAGKMGEAVAAALLKGRDDGRMPGEWGGGIDDEGAPKKINQVIARGRLVSYLTTTSPPEREGQQPDRQREPESIRHLPLPR